MPLRGGQRVGPYEIVATLGAGGMGVVYRALDTRLAREVALKVMADGFVDDASRQHRFEFEARAAGSLAHPNIVAVHDVGTSEAGPFIVMELLDGVTLRQRLDQGPIPVRKALQYAVQIAQGLAAAHEKGIVHRDLKPENLFLTGDGLVKILDFGLARSLPAPSGTLPQSQSGAVFGTSGYMSPEQVRGKPADTRSDIFSFGAVVFELLTGSPAFGGSTQVERCYAVLNSELADLALAAAGVPPAVEHMVRRCLEKRPEARFHSASDLGFALGAVADLSVDRPAPQHPGRPRAPLAVGALLVVLATGGGLGLSLRAASRSPPGVLPLPTFTRVSHREGAVQTARFGPGHSVLYAAHFGANPVQVFEGSFRRPEARPVSLPWTDLLDASRSGELLLSRRPVLLGTRWHPRTPGSVVSLMPLNGTPRDLANDVTSAAVSPDGQSMAFVRDVGSAAPLSARRRLEFPPGKVLLETSELVHGVRISPRGNALAAFFGDAEGKASSLEVVSTAGVRRRLSGPWAFVDGLAWSADGEEVWFAAGDTSHTSLRAVSLAGVERELLTTPGKLGLCDVSDRGQALVVVRETRVRVMGRFPWSAQDVDLSWLDRTRAAGLSADGRFVLLNEPPREVPDSGGASEEGRVFLAPTDGSPPVQLGIRQLSCLSPDGAWAAGVRRGVLQLVPTGPGEPRELSLGGVRGNPWTNRGGCVWASAGSNIVMWLNRPGHARQLFVQPLDGGLLRELSAEGVMIPTNHTSPDGRFIAAPFQDGGTEILSLEGAAPRPVHRLPPGDQPIEWTADGRGLFVVRSPSSRSALPAEVDRFELATGQLTPLMRITPSDPTGVDAYFGLDWVFVTPDGTSAVYEYTRSTGDLFLVEGLPPAGPP